MTSRAEVTSRYAKAYVKASKKDRGRILDAVVGVTGWSRDNARRRLVAAAKRSPGSGRQVVKRSRKPRSPKGTNGFCRDCLAGSVLVAAGGSALMGSDLRWRSCNRPCARWS